MLKTVNSCLFYSMMMQIRVCLPVGVYHLAIVMRSNDESTQQGISGWKLSVNETCSPHVFRQSEFDGNLFTNIELHFSSRTVHYWASQDDPVVF